MKGITRVNTRHIGLFLLHISTLLTCMLLTMPTRAAPLCPPGLPGVVCCDGTLVHCYNNNGLAVSCANSDYFAAYYMGQCDAGHGGLCHIEDSDEAVKSPGLVASNPHFDHSMVLCYEVSSAPPVCNLFGGTCDEFIPNKYIEVTSCTDYGSGDAQPTRNVCDIGDIDTDAHGCGISHQPNTSSPGILAFLVFCIALLRRRAGRTGSHRSAG